LLKAIELGSMGNGAANVHDAALAQRLLRNQMAEPLVGRRHLRRQVLRHHRRQGRGAVSVVRCPTMSAVRLSVSGLDSPYSQRWRRPQAFRRDATAPFLQMASTILVEVGQRSDLSRWRWAACLARLPQIAMLHHLRARPRVWSANSRVQVGPSHAFTLEKSSSQTNFASTAPIGSSNDSGDFHRRVDRNSRPEPLP